ncbi:hypothetical protein [Burkholderia sp. GbtcB21]|uniref:hypothetical protein n=1 Tax=Burkholderia sp. GbtcB21 TaxID=2824766 RepID=UPI001C2FFAD0|nr:hypothetical protein [Burkholderia sp. GbtcB21]
MSVQLRQDPTPYIAMKDAGASPQEVFRKAREDGYKNFECIVLISGVFEISLNDARDMAHAIYREDKEAG